MDKHERMEAVYRCFCAFLDGEGLHYQKEENEGEDKRIYLGFASEALPLHALFAFEEEASRIYVGSLLPAEAGAERADELVRAVLRINQVVAVGTFCVNEESGACTFESHETVAGVNAFSDDYPARVIGSTFAALKQYGGQLVEVARGTRTADEIVTGVEEDDE